MWTGSCVTKKVCSSLSWIAFGIVTNCLSISCSSCPPSWKKELLLGGVFDLPLFLRYRTGRFVPAMTALRNPSLAFERCYTMALSIGLPFISTLFCASLYATALIVICPAEVEVGENTVSYKSLNTSSFLRKLSMSARLSWALRLSLGIIVTSLDPGPNEILPNELYPFSFSFASRVCVLK